MGILDGKVGVVTGGGNGIGKATALLLAKEGASLIVDDLGGDLRGEGGSQGPADVTVEEIRKNGGTAHACYLSIASFENGQKIIQQCVDTFGRIDFLANIAGNLRDRMVFNMTEEEWDGVIAVHLKGYFNLIKFACTHMRQQQFGSIISFSSGSAAGASGQTNYAAGKAGILGMTYTVAKDMGKYGVRANAIWPGASTRMTASIPEAARQIRADRGIGGGGEARPAAVVDEAHMRSPDRVAPIVAYLASDDAKDISGHCIGLSGYTLSLIAHLEPIRTAYREGGWTVEAIRDNIRTVLFQNIKTTYI
ncbi:MAG: SDR family oxidoreductase [Candidatus Tectomicrobia bacterium]|nr:SDR family oxidoreductase [Candidatus Tectomicrobia bacterium]